MTKRMITDRFVIPHSVLEGDFAGLESRVFEHLEYALTNHAYSNIRIEGPRWVDEQQFCILADRPETVAETERRLHEENLAKEQRARSEDQARARRRDMYLELKKEFDGDT